MLLALLLLLVVVVVVVLITLSLPAGDKTQYFIHLSFNSTLQLINGISSGLQKLAKFFKGTRIVAFFKVPLA